MHRSRACMRLLALHAQVARRPTQLRLRSREGAACVQVCLVVPWGLQFLAYLLLYASFPADRDASIELERQRRLGAAVQGGSADGSAAAAAARGYVPPPRDWQAHGQSGCIVKRASDAGFAGV